MLVDSQMPGTPWRSHRASPDSRKDAGKEVGAGCWESVVAEMCPGSTGSELRV